MGGTTRNDPVDPGSVMFTYSCALAWWVPRGTGRSPFGLHRPACGWSRYESSAVSGEPYRAIDRAQQESAAIVQRHPARIDSIIIAIQWKNRRIGLGRRRRRGDVGDSEIAPKPHDSQGFPRPLRCHVGSPPRVKKRSKMAVLPGFL